jgi:hypothetical protein
MPLAATGLRLRSHPPSRRQRAGSTAAAYGLLLIYLAAALAAVITHPFLYS